MSITIEITRAQATALASLTIEGPIALRQLGDPQNAPRDIYVTPVGSHQGYRIAVDGTVSEIGETMPVPDGAATPA
jgi:hypothetical protein